MVDLLWEALEAQQELTTELVVEVAQDFCLEQAGLAAALMEVPEGLAVLVEVAEVMLPM